MFVKQLLSDFINLTQVHNFTVNAQDIFTFRRLSVFTVSFTRILQVMKCFALYYWLVNWFWYRVYNQKVLSSNPRKFLFFMCFFFVFLPLYSIRLTSLLYMYHDLWVLSFWLLYSKCWCVTHTLSLSVRNIYVHQNRIEYVIKRLKPPFLDPYFQFCNYSHVKVICLSILAFFIVIYVGSSPRTFIVRSICEVESLCFWYICFK